MSEPNLKHYIGDAEITRIPEISIDGVDIETLFPGSHTDTLIDDAKRWGRGNYEDATGTLRQSVHVWLVKTPTHTVLIDTATGNGKNRPEQSILHQLDEPFLERLEAAGVTADDIDYVLLTHIHADHVGWNTTWRDGRWQPTFPNALHVFSRREYDYNAALSQNREARAAAIRDEAALGRCVRLPSFGVFDDSVQPVVTAGLAQDIDINETEFEGFVYHRAPGHSIDHAAISYTSRGQTAFFWGDVLHHPLQVRRPELNSMFCEFPEAATRARHWALEYAADHDTTVFTTHFADTSAGHVTRTEGGFDWAYVHGEKA